MKTLTIFLMLLAATCAGQESLKTFIEKQVELKEVYVGEGYETIFSDSSNFYSGEDVAIWLEPWEPETTKFYAINFDPSYKKELIEGDTIKHFQEGRNDYQAQYLANGVVNYQQRVKYFVVKSEPLPKGELIEKVFIEAKKTGAKSPELQTALEFILKLDTVAVETKPVAEPIILKK